MVLRHMEDKVVGMVHLLSSMVLQLLLVALQVAMVVVDLVGLDSSKAAVTACSSNEVAGTLEEEEEVS